MATTSSNGRSHPIEEEAQLDAEVAETQPLRRMPRFHHPPLNVIKLSNTSCGTTERYEASTP